MLRNIIRRVFFISLKTSIVLALLLAMLIAWIYTGPRNVPFLASYIENSINDILPPSSSFSLERIALNIDENSHVTLQLINSRLIDENRGDFELEEMQANIDLLGLLPQSNHNLLNIQISQPKLKLANFLNTTNTDQKDASLPLEKINSYLNEYKQKILKFSISITNTKIAFDAEEGRTVEIDVNLLEMRPTLHKGNIILAIYGDFSVKNKNSIIDLSIDTTANTHLAAKGSVSNISSILFEEFGYKIQELGKSYIEADVSFDAVVSNSKSIDSLKFNVTNLEGKILKNKFFPVDILPQKFNVDGYCSKNCSELKVLDLHIKAQDLDLQSSFEIVESNNKNILKGQFNLKSIPVDKIQNYWPKPITARTRSWIFENISGGKLTSAKGSFNFDLDDLKNKKPIKSDNLNLELDLVDSSIKYMESVPKITDLSAKVFIKGQDISFEVSSAKLLESKIFNASGEVLDLTNSKSRVSVDAKVDGSLQNLIDIAYMHAELDNTKYLGLGGNAETQVKVLVPITDENISLKDIDINASTKITNASMQNVYKNFSGTNGNLEAVYKDHVTNLNGTAIVNEKLPVDITSRIDFLHDIQKINVKSSLSWNQIEDLGYQRPASMTGDLDAEVILMDEKGSISEIINLDLTKSSASVPQLNLIKEIGKPGYLNLETISEVDKSNNEKFNYEISLGSLFSKGIVEVATDDFKISKVESPETFLGDGIFSLNYNLKGKTHEVYISGQTLDISILNYKSESTLSANEKNNSLSQSNIKLSTNVKSIILKNKIALVNPELSLDCKGADCTNITLKGNYLNGTYLTFTKTPTNLKLFSNNAGLTFDGLDITDKVTNGVINVIGEFNDKKSFTGNVQLTSFQVIKAPLLTKVLAISSLTLSSFDGLVALVGDKGITFDKFSCPIKYSDSILNLSDCAAKGSTIAISTSGNIDIANDNIALSGVLIPDNIVNKVLKNIPVINQVFGKNDKDHEALGVNFKVTGTVDDPNVDANPLSLLTPGVFRNIFN